MQSQSDQETRALGPGNLDQVFGWALSQKHMERETLNDLFIQKVRSITEPRSAQLQEVQFYRWSTFGDFFRFQWQNMWLWCRCSWQTLFNVLQSTCLPWFWTTRWRIWITSLIEPDQRRNLLAQLRTVSQYGRSLIKSVQEHIKYAWVSVLAIFSLYSMLARIRKLKYW